MPEVHLVVLIHGLWGNPGHLAAAKEELESAYASRYGLSHSDTKIEGTREDPVIKTRLMPRSAQGLSNAATKGAPHVGEMVVLIAGGMTSHLTYDGIDVCASRVAWEVDEEIKELEQAGSTVTQFSVTGYSLGGLVARYLIGLLHARDPSFFQRHTPITFSSIATPHLGIPRYNTFLSTALVWLGARLLSRSGEQLYVADRYSQEDTRPLLEIIADPDTVFVQALEKFQTIEIFANGVNDHTVPYPSAAIETTDHFADWQERGLEVQCDEDEMITSWQPLIGSEVKQHKSSKKKWKLSLGTLPPVLQYRFPFNYIIMLLFPIMLPIVILLLQTRLQALGNAQAAHWSVGSASGISIHSLRQAIFDNDSKTTDLSSALDNSTTPRVRTSSSNVEESDTSSSSSGARLKLKDSQWRMALWLNRLPLRKYVTWYPDCANSHAVSIVRDPIAFPKHNRGRGLLKRWSSGIMRGHK